MTDPSHEPDYRAVFDARVSFSNGGGLSVEGFRVDVPGPAVTEDQVATLFLASLGLLLAESVALNNIQIVAEPHRGTRGGPSGPRRDRDEAEHAATHRHFVDLSHSITDSMITYPGLPAPRITPHLTREASRDVYEPGTEFTIDRISMVGNTGTYLDSPFHRYPDGADLAGLDLRQLAELPAVVVRTAGTGLRAVDIGALSAYEVTGRAVLLHTGGDTHWGSAQYAVDAPYLTEAGARWLVGHGARLVGIDSVNIDDASGQSSTPGARPAHTLLLGAGIPVVEHLTGLAQLPPYGARFSAVPPRVEGLAPSLSAPTPSCPRPTSPTRSDAARVGGLRGGLDRRRCTPACPRPGYPLPGRRRRRYVALNLIGSVGLDVNGLAHAASPSAALNLLRLTVALTSLQRRRAPRIAERGKMRSGRRSRFGAGMALAATSCILRGWNV